MVPKADVLSALASGLSSRRLRGSRHERTILSEPSRGVWRKRSEPLRSVALAPTTRPRQGPDVFLDIGDCRQSQDVVPPDLALHAERVGRVPEVRGDALNLAEVSITHGQS